MISTPKNNNHVFAKIAMSAMLKETKISLSIVILVSIRAVCCASYLSQCGEDIFDLKIHSIFTALCHERQAFEKHGTDTKQSFIYGGVPKEIPTFRLKHTIA